MEIKSIHIAVEVRNLQSALTFWEPLMAAAGFKKGWRDNTFASWVNSSYTVFIGEANPGRISRKAPTGQEFVVAEHFGFSVARKEDVESIERAMTHAGFSALFPFKEYTEFGPGFFGLTYCDADNNVVEFGYRAQPAGEQPVI